MDITQHVAGADSYDRLSTFQIIKFFERHSPTTRDECDGLAASILGCPVASTPVQGANSYTVMAAAPNQASKVVQFRSRKLDVKLVELARLSYGSHVPNCTPQSPLPGDVHVYVWDLIPGVAFCRVRRRFFTLNIGMEQHLYRTVEDFARFFASAWNNRQQVEQPPGLLEEYRNILDRVSRGLPERLQAKADEIRQQLPLLFRPDYPTACQHDDLLENNIHVDEATGRITGIVDWPDAIIAPFGVSLWGLETVLGVQTLTTWHLHSHHVRLREHFWETFYGETGNVSEEDQRSIEVARLFGIFQKYGFEDKERATRCLEVLCLV